MFLAPFTFLLAGHLFADFVLQSDALVEQKRNPNQRGAALSKHQRQVCLAHFIFLLPWNPILAAIIALPLGLIHLAIDRWKLKAERAKPHLLRWFAWDQLFHLASLALIAAIMMEMPDSGRIEGWILNPAIIELLFFTTFLVFLMINGRLGGFLVGEFLRRYKPDATPAGFAETQVELAGDAAESEQLRTGRVIGILERCLLFIILIQGEWGAAGFVIAAKSIVRFQNLEDRAFAEYYLVGTLASFLFALVTALGYEVYLGWLVLG